MKPALSRRAFLKLAGTGAAASTIAATIPNLPSLNDPGLNHFRFPPALKPYGSIAHPEPDATRLDGPYIQTSRGSKEFEPIDWASATVRLAQALRNYASCEIAFLLGLYPDHLNHLVQMIAGILGEVSVLRYDPAADFEGRVTLIDAAQGLFGISRLPIFDFSQAELIYTFGASFREPWIAVNPKSQEDAIYDKIPEMAGRQWVHFGARRPPLAERSHTWIPIRPGSEALLAHTLVRLINGDINADDLEQVASQIGMNWRELHQLARHFKSSKSRLAFPGAMALGSANGSAAAQWILALNLPPDGIGREGNFFLPPESPLYPALRSRPSTAAELDGLRRRMAAGQIKLLFVHGIDPLAALPMSFDIHQGLEKVEQVISFSPIWDGLSSYANLLLPDHIPNESRGYQLPPQAADWGRIDLLQPQLPPANDTRPSADILLSALELSGFGRALPFLDERDFIQKSFSSLTNHGGVFDEKGAAESSQCWLDRAGWHRLRPIRFTPVSVQSHFGRGRAYSTSSEDFPLLLSIEIENSQAFHASLETCAELHPVTAGQLDVETGDRVRIKSAAGEICLNLKLNEELHPAALMVQWHPEGEQENCPLNLLGREQIESGCLVYQGMRVGVKRLAG
jgi:anaerobic selenocysteine-containing dehydrogenase